MEGTCTGEHGVGMVAPTNAVPDNDTHKLDCAYLLSIGHHRLDLYSVLQDWGRSI